MVTSMPTDSNRRWLAVLALAFLMGVPATAQWLKYPTAGIPRLSDGKPNLAAPPPRSADGKPDLSGIWRPDAHRDVRTVRGQLVTGYSKYFVNIAADLPSGEAPLQPFAAALYRQHVDDFGKDNPTNRCLPHGLPRMWTQPAPLRIIQTPGLTTVLQEFDTSFRLIFTDGRGHPDTLEPTWMGYSIGTWREDTFIVDTKGFNDRTWLDATGHPHSEALHVIERFQRRDFGHLSVDMTIDDPKAYTAPLTIAQGLS
jgi:hypothetical protein